MTASESQVAQHVFVMRHGERLDSMDRNWKRTAVRPYDTPLTHHGHNEANRLVKCRLAGKVCKLCMVRTSYTNIRLDLVDTDANFYLQLI